MDDTTLPTEGFVRINKIVKPNGVLPIGQSKWWKGIRDGEYPKPVKLGPNTTAWKVEDIRSLIEQLGRESVTA